MKRENYLVDIRNKEKRQKFIENLEMDGYTVDEEIFSKDSIICNIFPIIVETKNKKISMIGNTTTAAAAASSNKLISQEEFEKYVIINADK